MTREELYEHYGISPATSNTHNIELGPLLIQWRWGNSCWDSLNIKEECYTDMLRLSLVRSHKYPDLQFWQFICWRLVVTWSVVRK